MTDEKIKNSPWMALMYFTDKLSEEQFDYCVRACPSTALKYFSHKLTPEQKQYCEEKTK